MILYSYLHWSQSLGPNKYGDLIMTNIVRFTSAVASICLAAIPIVAVASSVHAAPAPVTVKVGDLNLAHADQAAKFQARIKTATRALCSETGPGVDLGSRKACERAVTEEVIAKLSDNQRQSLRVGAAEMVASAR
jgi:UrcA family protein